MKRHSIYVGILLAVAAMLPLQSCIGSFSLTKKVLTWNDQIGSKFVNELVFFAFWILPVYEVTALADILVLNSIEFWSGNVPIEGSTQVIDTDQGRYMITADASGYSVTAPNGDVMRLDYESADKTWSVVTPEGEAFPFMTMVDENHVKMITPEGDMRMVELSEDGVMAYSKIAGAPMAPMMALR